MPGFIARKLCPQLVIVPLNFDKYSRVSDDVRQVLADYDANFSAMSLDEAHLDFTEHLRARATLSEAERSFVAVNEDVEQCVCRSNPSGMQESILNLLIRHHFLFSYFKET